MGQTDWTLFKGLGVLVFHLVKPTDLPPDRIDLPPKPLTHLRPDGLRVHRECLGFLLGLLGIVWLLVLYKWVVDWLLHN